MKQRRLVIAAVAAVMAAACGGMMMGTPKPVQRDVLITHADTAVSAEKTAQMLTQRSAEFAIVSAPRDTAWFADVARRANLTSTRPGKVSGTTYAFMGPKAIGDTTLTLTVTGGGVIRMHDALFEIDKNHHLDLMAVQMDSIVNVQRAVNRLLEYIAGDVGATASVLFAIEAPSAAIGDSIAVLMRPLYTELYECTAEGRSGGARAPAAVRVYFGPVARMRCQLAQRLDPGTLLGQFEIGL
jgi:hypothetical protein